MSLITAINPLTNVSRRCVAGALTLLLFASAAQAATLAQWTLQNEELGADLPFTSQQQQENTVTSALTQVGLTGSVVNTSIPGDSLDGNAFQIGAGAIANIGTPVFSDDYMQFSVTPDAGYQMTFDAVSIDFAAASNVQSGSSATFRVQFFYSTDGGESFTALGSYTQVNVNGITTTAFTDVSESLSALGTQSGETIFRVAFGDNTSSTDRALYWRNLELTGSVTQIPEAGSSVMLFGVCALLFLGLHRRYRK